MVFRLVIKLEESIKEVKISKSSFWKSIAAVLVVCGGLITIIGFWRGEFSNKSNYITKEDLKTAIMEINKR